MNDIEIFVPEFEYRKKERIWYLSIILLALLLVFFALLANNQTFIAVIILGSILLIMRSNTKPQLVPFAIHDKGIYFKNKLWEYKNIKDFSLYKIGAQDYFTFNPKGNLQIAIKVPVKDPEIITKKLNNLCSQVEYQESLIDIIIRLIGL